MLNVTDRVTICHVLHGLEVGGAEVLASRLARQFHRSGLVAKTSTGFAQHQIRFLFVCLDVLGSLGRELHGEGYHVEVIGRRPGVDWGCAWRLARLLRREHVDLVHAHQYTPFFYAAAARLLVRKPAILFTEHGRFFPDNPRRKRIIANRLLLEQRDRVIGVGHAVRQALIDIECIPAERVGVIHNGIDPSLYSSAHGWRTATRRNLGVSDDDVVMLQVARLDRMKDHATAIRTLRRVLLRRSDVKLVIAGDGPEFSTIREMVRQDGLESHVRLLGPRSDVARLLAAADLFLLTSIAEGVPLAIIEAMAAGLPVVATDVGGVAEVVADGETGLIASPGDDARLAQRLLQLAADPALRRTLGQRGRRRAETFFSEQQMHAAYARLYAEMLVPLRRQAA